MSTISKLKYYTNLIFKTEVIDKVNYLLDRISSSVIVVSSPEQLSGELSSDKVYKLDGIIDFTGTGHNITIPPNGLNIKGDTFDVSGLVCEDDNYSLFVTAPEGGGNLSGIDFYIKVSGSNSKVYGDIESFTGFNAIELRAVNYIDCTSLGSIVDYRQLLEEGTGRLGGTPELTFSGSWGGARISTSIAFNMSNMSSLFKAGPDLTFSGRFITDINCNLPALGSLIDFDETNILGDESLIFNGALVRREGIADASDTTLFPNINEYSVKSLWKNNTGLPNTVKYLKATYTTEVETPIVSSNTFYPLLGTVTVNQNSHIGMPSNGEYELLSGNGVYNITGSIVVKGIANKEINIRVVKSTDGGVNYDSVIATHVGIIANFSGVRDVAIVSISGTKTLSRGDRVRLEVSNLTDTSNVTVEIGSHLTILAL